MRRAPGWAWHGMGDQTFASITCVLGLMPGECLAGALYWKDLYRIAEEVGFSPPCLVTSSPITIGNKELENLIGESLTRECGIQEAMGSCARIPGPAASQPACSVPNPSLLQVTAALSQRLSASSRCQLAASPVQARSSTTVGSWGMSKSWCLMPTSPSRCGATYGGSPGCQAVLVCRDWVKLCSAAEQCPLWFWG